MKTTQKLRGADRFPPPTGFIVQRERERERPSHTQGVSQERLSFPWRPPSPPPPSPSPREEGRRATPAGAAFSSFQGLSWAQTGVPLSSSAFCSLEVSWKGKRAELAVGRGGQRGGRGRLAGISWLGLSPAWGRRDQRLGRQRRPRERGEQMGRREEQLACSP